MFNKTSSIEFLKYGEVYTNYTRERNTYTNNYTLIEKFSLYLFSRLNDQHDDDQQNASADHLCDLAGKAYRPAVFEIPEYPALAAAGNLTLQFQYYERYASGHGP